METGKGKSDTGSTVATATGVVSPPIVPTKNDFDLHVLLAMRQDKLAKSKALLIAYQEGNAGLAKRLA